MGGREEAYHMALPAVVSLILNRLFFFFFIGVGSAKCVLFSDSVEDDRRAMYEAGLQAMAEPKVSKQYV